MHGTLFLCSIFFMDLSKFSIKSGEIMNKLQSHSHVNRFEPIINHCTFVSTIKSMRLYKRVTYRRVLQQESFAKGSYDVDMAWRRSNWVNEFVLINLGLQNTSSLGKKVHFLIEFKTDKNPLLIIIIERSLYLGENKKIEFGFTLGLGYKISSWKSLC